MEKVKVIEFIQSMGDGGAETLVKDYALLMDKERFDVTVVVLHDIRDSANYRFLIQNGIPVYALSSQEDPLKKLWRKLFPVSETDMPTEEDPKKGVQEAGGTFGKLKSLARNLYFGIKFLAILKKTGATVVHAHLEVLEILQAVSGQLKDIRLLHTCHNPPAVIYTGAEQPAAEHLIRKNNMQIVALHEKMAQELNDRFGVDNTAVIRNGIMMERFTDPGLSKEEKRMEIGIPEDAFVVGHVGRFFEQKNHPFLVEVFREIAARQEKAFLLMVGAGDTTRAEETLKQYGLGDRYLILSHRQDIPQLLAAMDVFVFPSIFEGFGIALLEAQAAGVRCVASDRCPPEVIRRADCIPLPLGSAETWAETALNPQILRDSVRDLNDYDMNREIRRLERLYLGSPEETID